MVRKDDQGPWSMNFNLPSKNRGKDGGNGEENKDNDGNNRGPPKVVNTDMSSSQSQTSSIGIGALGKTQHAMDKKGRMKAKHHVQESTSKNRQNNNAEERGRCKENPPREVSFERCTEESKTSESIGIGEFTMTTSKKGNMTMFKMGIREKLFPKVKFLSGTNTNLDYSTDPMSICGLLKRHCNIDKENARLWWEIQCNTVKGIHTDCQNNKIKTIKQIFTGK